MPELPEVETTLRGIAPHILHKRIHQVIIRQSKLRWPIPSNIKHKLQGKTICQAVRRAKYILLTTEAGTVIIHLGMSGHLRILKQPLAHQKHDHIDLIFSDQTILRFTDPRRFGAFLWVKEDPYQHPLLKHLGVEPLSKAFSGTYLWRLAQNKSICIKSFLMDSKKIAGIGNIYATESLFAAGIHPNVSVQSISLERFNLLAKSIKTILKKAIQKGGTTLKDFSDSKGKPGYFFLQLKVYGRAGLKCTQCHGVLQLMRIGQRSTVFCKHCQH